MHWKGYTVLLIFITSSCIGFTQYKTNAEFMVKKQQIGKSGMVVLSSWAGANIAVGTAGWIATEGESKYFNQMNVFWNIVNLGIAVPGLINSNKEFSKGVSTSELIKSQYSSEQVYLINNALNVLYISSGALLKTIAYQYPNTEARLQGYGNSMLLQGGFLLVFDLVQYFRHRKQRKSADNLFIDQLSMSSNGIGLKYTFR